MKKTYEKIHMFLFAYFFLSLDIAFIVPLSSVIINKFLILYTMNI